MSSDKENKRPTPHARRPLSAISPPFGYSHLGSPLNLHLSYNSQPSPVFRAPQEHNSPVNPPPANFEPPVRLPPIQLGAVRASHPGPYIPSPVIRYPSLHHLAQSFHSDTNLLQSDIGAPGRPLPMSPQPASPTRPWPSIPATLGLQPSLVPRPSSPARLLPGHPMLSPATGGMSLVPGHKQSHDQVEQVIQRVEESTGPETLQGNIRHGPPQVTGEGSRPSQAKGKRPAAIFKFKPDGPDMRDVLFIRLLSALNPFDGTGHKLDTFGECGKKLKTSPETADLFKLLSDNPNNKTLLNRYKRLKYFSTNREGLNLEGETSETEIDFRNRIRMLMRDEDDYKLKRQEASEKRQVLANTPVFAANLREQHAQTWANQKSPAPSPSASSGTVRAGMDSSTSEEDSSDSSASREQGKSGEKAKRQKQSSPRSASLGRIHNEIKDLNKSAVKAQEEQSLATQKLFAADLALKEKAFEFNSGVRKREVELAERRLEHDIAQQKSSKHQIDELKADFGSQFQEVKQLLGLVLAGKGPQASGSS